MSVRNKQKGLTFRWHCLEWNKSFVFWIEYLLTWVIVELNTWFQPCLNVQSAYFFIFNSTLNTNSHFVAGEQGEQGQKGEQGTAGLNGLNGSKGERGSTGFKGDRGSAGANGAQGATGSTGNKGADFNCWLCKYSYIIC